MPNAGQQPLRSMTAICVIATYRYFVLRELCNLADRDVPACFNNVANSTKAALKWESQVRRRNI